MPKVLNMVGELAAENMLTELWHELGQPKALKKEIELKKELIEANIAYIKSSDRSWLNDIKLLQAELDKHNKDSKDSFKYDFNKEVRDVAIRLGVGILNQKKTTVFDYYNATIS
jgi:hypothetical protein